MSCTNKQVPLFHAGAVRAIRLVLDDAATLQRFYQENPEYFLIVSGQVAGPNTARDQLEGDVPAQFSFSTQFAIGFFNQSERLIGVADVVSDLLAPGVWHIGLFMVATEQRGSGLGSSIYRALEGWIEQTGARWVRLGVVVGNSVAERFWAKHNFTEITVKHGVLTEGRLNDVSVMVKPLGQYRLDQYLELVPGDQAAKQQPG